MISTLLFIILYVMRGAIGLISVAEWSGHYESACGENCDGNAVLDNNPNTFWNAYESSNPSAPEWITFDFGIPVKIYQFDFQSYGDRTHDTKDFTLKGGNTKDGPFTSIFSGTAAAATSDVQSFTIDVNSHALGGYQFVKLTLVNRYSEWQGWVREVDFQYEDARICELDMCTTLNSRIDAVVSHLQGTQAAHAFGGDVIGDSKSVISDSFVFSKIELLLLCMNILTIVIGLFICWRGGVFSKNKVQQYTKVIPYNEADDVEKKPINA